MLRKDQVTPRERMYIEAWEAAWAPEYAGDLESLESDRPPGFPKLAEELEMIVLEYPDDLEAKALLGLYSLYDAGRIGNDLLLRAVLAGEPEHPGAHHYRIHNWDGPEGAQALDSCAVYGRLAWNVGHANHMPGHIYSGIGMWHEGAIWMDSATRVEKRYMQQRMIFPFNHWNYAHNRNYLSYIQEQLGMAEAALDGGRQLLAAPLDPKYNDPDGAGYVVFRQGMRALVRGLVKFERWEEILEPGTVPWRETLEDRVWRTYLEALAHLELGRVTEANEKLVELKELEEEVASAPQEERGGARRYHARQLAEVRGLLELERGEVLEGLKRLSDAAAEQWEGFERDNDPPNYPRVLYNVLGEVYLARQSAGLAAEAFEKTLEVVPNDGFALAGLARARAALGEREAAEEAYGRLLFVWSDADPGLRWMEEARALGLEAQPTDDSPAPQRNYRRQTLDSLGPNVWEPYDAPELEVLDPEREMVTLEEYRGRNVLLVFYIGEDCAHCVEQLVEISDRIVQFRLRDVEVLAVSGDSPEANAESLAMGELPLRLLSDEGFANARRFKSYDEFEDLELHSTIFIDRQGRVRWARSGGDPFMDFDFLLEEIDRVEETAEELALLDD